MHVAPESSLFAERLRGTLPAFLARQRWFGGKARRVDSVDLLDVVPLKDRQVSAELVLAQVHYEDHAPDEVYCVPLLNEPGRRLDSEGRARGLPAAAGELSLQDALLEP